jgi:hypothetical protein
LLRDGAAYTGRAIDVKKQPSFFAFNAGPLLLTRPSTVRIFGKSEKKVRGIFGKAAHQKLEQFTKLSDEDKQVLKGAAREVEVFGSRQDIIIENDKPDVVRLILDDWSAHYKVLPNGDRSIMAYLISGDLCDIHVTLLD